MTRRSLTKLYAEAQAAAEAEHAERRKLVLGFDDLAKRLTQQPVRYASPEQWNGYIPPLMVEGPHNDRTHRDSMTRNPSPQRVHLVAICHEAYARTFGEEAGRANLDEINTDRWPEDRWTPHTAAEGN
jgi:hypothetical protein